MAEPRVCAAGVIALHDRAYPELQPGGVLRLLITDGSQGARAFADGVGGGRQPAAGYALASATDGQGSVAGLSRFRAYQAGRLPIKFDVSCRLKSHELSFRSISFYASYRRNPTIGRLD